MPSINGDQILGYWGRTSSTIDWCEDNYVVGQYFAEFWNTVSSLMMILPALGAVIYALYKKLEHRMIICYLSFLLVGLGSWCFHMTLKYSMQLLDELPMIWGTSALLYSIIEVDKPLKTHNRGLQVALLLYCFIVTMVYVWTKSPLFFQVSYILIVLLMGGYCFKMISKYGWKLKAHFQLIGACSYVIGGILWTIETHYCSTIREVRANGLSALGPLTQLHAWWHLFAGLGTYMTGLFVFHSRYALLSQIPQIKFLLGVWPYQDVTKPLRTD